MKPIDILRAHLLLVLEQEPDIHGYEAHKRVAARGIKGGAERTYRALRAMDEDELVSSRREKSPIGPERRHYKVTARGRARLAGLAVEAQQTSIMLERLAQDAMKIKTRGKT